MSDESTQLVTVLNDGDTYTGTEGTMIAAVPDRVFDDDDVESFLKEGNYDHLNLGEVKDSATILRFFRLFFPGMEVGQDNDGQVIIHTGITESKE
jgi:hypothetical protein